LISGHGFRQRYGRQVGVELSAGKLETSFGSPSDFLHGYCTLTEETEVIYKVNRPLGIERRSVA